MWASRKEGSRRASVRESRFPPAVTRGSWAHCLTWQAYQHGIATITETRMRAILTANGTHCRPRSASGIETLEVANVREPFPAGCSSRCRIIFMRLSLEPRVEHSFVLQCAQFSTTKQGVHPTAVAPPLMVITKPAVRVH